MSRRRERRGKRHDDDTGRYGRPGRGYARTASTASTDLGDVAWNIEYSTYSLEKKVERGEDVSGLLFRNLRSPGDRLRAQPYSYGGGYTSAATTSSATSSLTPSSSTSASSGTSATSRSIGSHAERHTDRDRTVVRSSSKIRVYASPSRSSRGRSVVLSRGMTGAEVLSLVAERLYLDANPDQDLIGLADAGGYLVPTAELGPHETYHVEWSQREPVDKCGFCNRFYADAGNSNRACAELKSRNRRDCHHVSVQVAARLVSHECVFCRKTYWEDEKLRCSKNDTGYAKGRHVDVEAAVEVREPSRKRGWAGATGYLLVFVFCCCWYSAPRWSASAVS